MKASRCRIIVSGLVGLYPIGGMAWHYLQYVIGLARLGHDVYYHEDTWSWPYHPLRKTYISDGAYSARYIERFFERYAEEFSEHWHYRHLNETSFGMDRASFEEVARTADLFLNVSGACRLPDTLSPRCIKAFLDTDPGYNQIVLTERPEWSENVDRWCKSVASHDRHFTFAENFGGADCLIPEVGIAWTTTRMPVVLDLWDWVAHARPPKEAPWTTVMTWNAFKGKLRYKGEEYKNKRHEFERLMIGLPGRVTVPLRVTTGLKAPVQRLIGEGWRVADGASVTRTPGHYQQFIAGSRGEVSPAKHVYVAMRSGWFSCRSTCYLAAARPVVVQDTGLPSVLPVGEGILTFTTAEGAADAIRDIEENYERHSKQARAMAEGYFDSNKVLGRLVEEAMDG